MVGITNMNHWAGSMNDAIVVYPDGVGVGATSCWSIPGMVNVGQCFYDVGNDDVGFINALIDEMIRRYSIDESRIYAAGFSNGGMMALNLACRLSHRIAAFGVVSGGPMVNLVAVGSLTVNSWQCPWGARQGKVPVMFIHGKSDTITPHQHAPDTVSWLAAQHGYTQLLCPLVAIGCPWVRPRVQDACDIVKVVT